MPSFTAIKADSGWGGGIRPLHESAGLQQQPDDQGAEGAGDLLHRGEDAAHQAFPVFAGSQAVVFHGVRQQRQGADQGAVGEDAEQCRPPVEQPFRLPRLPEKPAGHAQPVQGDGSDVHLPLAAALDDPAPRRQGGQTGQAEQGQVVGDFTCGAFQNVAKEERHASQRQGQHRQLQQLHQGQQAEGGMAKNIQSLGEGIAPAGVLGGVEPASVCCAGFRESGALLAGCGGDCGGGWLSCLVGAERPACAGSRKGDQPGSQGQSSQAEAERRIAGGPVAGGVHQQRAAHRAEHHAEDQKTHAHGHQAGARIVGGGQGRRHGQVGNGEHRVGSGIDDQGGKQQRRGRRHWQTRQVEKQREACGQGEGAQQQIGPLGPPAVLGAVADGAHHRVRDRVVQTHGKQQDAGQGGADPQHGGHVEQREQRHGVERRAGRQGAGCPGPGRCAGDVFVHGFKAGFHAQVAPRAPWPKVWPKALNPSTPNSRGR